MADPSWYRQIFNEEYLFRYGPSLTPERTQAEVEGLLRLLSLPPGSALLDLCCGHGRHAVPLAQRGYRVTGQDLSEVFLARARESAEAAGVSVRWVHGDMRQIPFTGEFDAVINIFTAFGYLESEDEDQQVLREVAKALKPGGLFLQEIIHRDTLLRRYLPYTVQRYEDGTLEISEHRFDLLTSREEKHGTVIYPDGRRSENRHSLRLYTTAELRRMLAAAGLEFVAAYGGLDGSPLTLESRRLALLARKSV